MTEVVLPPEASLRMPLAPRLLQPVIPRRQTCIDEEDDEEDSGDGDAREDQDEEC